MKNYKLKHYCIFQFKQKYENYGFEIKVPLLSVIGNIKRYLYT